MTDADVVRPEEPEVDPERPPRERIFNLPLVVILLLLTCVGVHMARVGILSPEQDAWLLVEGAFFPLRYTGGYDLELFTFASPVTYSFLHGGWAHLLVNMIWLAAFGSPLATRLGWTRFLAFWVVTSIAAAGLHFVMHPYDDAPLIGASGAISGMMGAAARFAFRVDRSGHLPGFSGPVLPVTYVLQLRPVLIFLTVWMLINLVTGVYSLVPNMEDPIAWEAHIGGFVVGFFGVGLFDRPRYREDAET